eukprot:SAG31_NODE_47191_length_251_cov_0.848684_1_plen_44_part_01
MLDPELLNVVDLLTHGKWLMDSSRHWLLPYWSVACRAGLQHLLP